MEFLENPSLIGGMVIVISTLTGFLIAGAKYVIGRLENVLEKNTKALSDNAESTRLLASSVRDLKDSVEENTRNLFEFRKEQAVFNAQFKHV